MAALGWLLNLGFAGTENEGPETGEVTDERTMIIEAGDREIQLEASERTIVVDQ